MEATVTLLIPRMASLKPLLCSPSNPSRVPEPVTDSSDTSHSTHSRHPTSTIYSPTDVQYNHYPITAISR